jgi:hypothetical protein
MEKSDWIGIFALLLIVISGGLFTYYYVVYEIHSCTASPVLYAANNYVKGSYNFTFLVLNIYENIDDEFSRESIRYYYGPPIDNYMEYNFPNLSNIEFGDIVIRNNS